MPGVANSANFLGADPVAVGRAQIGASRARRLNIGASHARSQPANDPAKYVETFSSMRASRPPRNSGEIRPPVPSMSSCAGFVWEATWSRAWPPATVLDFSDDSVAQPRIGHLARLRAIIGVRPRLSRARAHGPCSIGELPPAKPPCANLFELAVPRPLGDGIHSSKRKSLESGGWSGRALNLQYRLLPVGTFAAPPLDYGAGRHVLRARDEHMVNLHLRQFAAVRVRRLRAAYHAE